jgi:hypothetical protein
MPAIDVHCIERGSRPQPDLRQLERLRNDSTLLAEHDSRPKRQRTRAEQRRMHETAAIDHVSHLMRFRPDRR